MFLKINDYRWNDPKIGTRKGLKLGDRIKKKWWAIQDLNL